ncbi:MAG: hypothetical protein V4503_03315 [Gemmatimonadota bacterium]
MRLKILPAFVSLLLFLCLGGARQARAQLVQRERIDSGALVRMTVTGAPAFRGRLLTPLLPGQPVLHYCRYPALPCRVNADTSAARSLEVARLTRLERQVGSYAGRGAMIAGVIGAVGGGYLGYLLTGLCDAPCGGPTRGAIGVGLGTGLFFAGIGALIGSGFGRYHDVR